GGEREREELVPAAAVRPAADRGRRGRAARERLAHAARVPAPRLPGSAATRREPGRAARALLAAAARGRSAQLPSDPVLHPPRARGPEGNAHPARERALPAQPRVPTRVRRL